MNPSFDYSPARMENVPLDNSSSCHLFRTPENENPTIPPTMHQQPFFAAHSFSEISGGFPPPPEPPMRATSSFSYFSGDGEYFDSTVYPALKLAECLPSPSPTKQTKNLSSEPSPKKQRTSSSKKDVPKTARRASDTSVRKGKLSPKKKTKTFYEPKSIDVNCRMSSSARTGSVMYEGSQFYRDAVKQFGMTIEKDLQSKNLNQKQLKERLRRYSVQVVKMIRDRGSRFLFSKAKGEPFYDIGDEAAITKTIGLLKKFLNSGDDKPKPSDKAGDHVTDLQKFAVAMSNNQNNDTELEEVFGRFIAIPPKADDL